MCVRTVWSEGKTEASQLLWVTSDWLKRSLCIGKMASYPKPPRVALYVSEPQWCFLWVERRLTPSPFVWRCLNRRF